MLYPVARTELATFTDDEYIHLGGDELLQDALNPHDCWQAAPEIAAWMNATFPPAGRDPRGAGGYGTFRLNFHRFDRFELDLRGHTQP